MTRSDRRTFLRSLLGGAPAALAVPEPAAPPGFSLEEFYTARGARGGPSAPFPEVRVSTEALAAKVIATSVGIPPPPDDPATLVATSQAARRGERA